MDVITLPRRTRESSFTVEDIEDALDTLDAIEPGTAAVVERGFENENSARNRARLLAIELNKRTGLLYSAHAVPDPDDDATTYIGAISVRANQNPREASNDRPEGAPTLRALQEVARELKIKGRSKLDYDGLWNALTAEDIDPMSYGTGNPSA